MDTENMALARALLGGFLSALPFSFVVGTLFMLVLGWCTP
jgi:uncharacterized membrane protein YdcZ (DUF606 family)